MVCLHTGFMLRCWKQEAELTHAVACHLKQDLDSLRVAHSQTCFSKAVSPRRQEDRKRSFENGRWNWCNRSKDVAFLLKLTGFDELSLTRICVNMCLCFFYFAIATQVDHPPRSLTQETTFLRVAANNVSCPQYVRIVFWMFNSTMQGGKRPQHQSRSSRCLSPSLFLSISPLNFIRSIRKYYTISNNDTI